MSNGVADSESEIVIRRMAPSDAIAAAELSSELGYPVAPDVMEARLRQFSGMKDHAVFAACRDGRVVGWVDVCIVHHLQSGSSGEIGGLIVAHAYQGRGAGGKLVRAAEEWIRSQDISNVVVRSQIAREAAHAFYLRQKFSRLKTSAVFNKTIEHTQS
jgi:GNAT superfamily N-acetyltransferase